MPRMGNYKLYDKPYPTIVDLIKGARIMIMYLIVLISKASMNFLVVSKLKRAK